MEQMTASNLATLLSNLSDTVGTLNRESDSINELIERFEDTLRQLNIGLEVWCSEPIGSMQFDRRASNGEKMPPLLGGMYLGFARRAGEWHLCLQPRTTVVSQDGNADAKPLPRPASSNDKLLRDCSRAQRIAALRQFPALLSAMKAEVQASLQAIQDTKKFLGLA